MKKYPNLITLENVINTANDIQANINGRWVPARPLGYPSLRMRIKITWMVWTGKCDAIKWPEGQ